MKYTVLLPLVIGAALSSCNSKEAADTQPENKPEPTAKVESTRQEPAPAAAAEVAASPAAAPQKPQPAAKPAVRRAQKQNPLEGEWLPTGESSTTYYSYEFGNGELTILAKDSEGNAGDISLLNYTLTQQDGKDAITLSDESNNKQTHFYTIQQDTLTITGGDGQVISTWKRN